jgi:hypothetical protein
MEQMVFYEPVREVVTEDLMSGTFLSVIDLVRRVPQHREGAIDGWLKVKRTGFLRHTWKQLYCVLSDRILKGSFREDDKCPKYFLNFDLISVGVRVSGKELYISPKGSSKVFGFTSASSEVFEIWKNAITQAIMSSQGFSNELSNYTNLRRWWKKPSVNFDQFISHVETGDLLLFKSKSVSSMAIRVASRSDFDHVAFLFTLETGEIYMMESLGRTGVQVLSLEWFLANKWQFLYSKIVHRKLICHRDPTFYQLFIAYANAWKGRPYRMTMSKLVTKASSDEEFNDFFCSQLVAALYKKLDLLPDDVSSCTYWPSNFSVSRNMKLKAPAYLGEERKINFY